jgi:CTP-dependent riboflavin kinase
MIYKGFVKKGIGVDSKRDNWGSVKKLFDFKPYKGTLNISLHRTVDPSSLNYDFKIFNKFKVIKGVLKSHNKQKNVYVGYKEDFYRIIMFFIISDVNLRDELKLKDGDTVEVIL